ncbi:hypothetical protein ACF08E_11015 [Streptomyces globisporus]|uniref:hypothetical protein n=1 Tax=Streptomyces globisporus TaxID=1908 RepID=UPI0036FD9447
MPCPAESRFWWMLGDLFTWLHRDVESLVYALVEFRKLEVEHDNDVDPEDLSARFKETVGAFDSTPFADDESQWNLSLEELEHGIW